MRPRSLPSPMPCRVRARARALVPSRWWFARCQVEVAVVVVDVLVRGDRDAAERVHQVREAGEVDLDVVVHADVRHGLHRLHRADRAADRVRAC